jgi:thiol-disulfide isomerase/thioredoxin
LTSTGAPPLGVKARLSREEMAKFLNAADSWLHIADKLLTHADATKDQKSVMRMRKVETLWLAARIAPGNFASRFDAYVDQLVEDNPKGPDAALGLARRFMNRFVEGNGDKKDAVKELETYASTFTDHVAGPQLFAQYCDKLPLSEQLALLRKGLEIYAKAKNPRVVSVMKGLLLKREIIGQPLDIAGPSLSGTQFNITSLKGRVVLVDFWATFCGPCIAKMPALKRFYAERRRNDFDIVGISLDDDKAALERFVKKNHIPWTQVFFNGPNDRGFEHPLAKKFYINVIPANFLIDRAGKVTHVDLRDEKAIEQAVIELLTK